MKRGHLLLSMVCCVAAVLAVSLVAGQHQRSVLLEGFQQQQEALCAAGADSLAVRLADAVRDGRFLARLIDETRQSADLSPQAQAREISSAFKALATSVAHYRTIAAFGAPGELPVEAIDPTEDRERVAAGLLAQSRVLAAGHAAEPAGTFWSAPMTMGLRGFHLLGLNTSEGVRLVVSIDTSLLLSGVFSPPPPHARAAVIDPSGAVWMGCGQCGKEGWRFATALSATSPGNFVRLPQGLDAWRALADEVNPSRALRTERTISAPMGAFRLLMLSATDSLIHRQRVAIAQLLLTAAGVIASLVFFGILLLRQQGRSSRLAERLEAAEEIANLKERSEKILENAPLGILGLTRDSRPAFVNQFLRRKLGHQAADGAAPPAVTTWLQLIRPWLDQAFAEMRPTFLPTKDVPRDTPGLEEVEVQLVPLAHAIDEVEALALIRDVSEIRKLERQLIRAEKLVTVGALSAGLAHEIGTPLMVIRGRAESRLELEVDKAAREDLETIVGQIDRIVSIVSQVLDFSRAEPAATQPTDSAKVARSSVELLHWRLSRRGVTASVAAPTGLPLLQAHAGQLEQVFVNLIMNACDASAEGGEIVIRLREDDTFRHMLRIEVEDGGAGIPGERIHAVFDPYFTTKKQGEGTGLGLTVVAQIVASHDGEISLQSTPDVGTKAIILWPVA